MPRFFFDIECSEVIADRIKAELPDLEAARSYAQGLIGVIMHGRGGEPWRMTIRNEKSEAVDTLASETTIEDDRDG